MARSNSSRKSQKDRQSRDGRKPTTKGGKGGKVQQDGTHHRTMGYLAMNSRPATVNNLKKASPGKFTRA